MKQFLIHIKRQWSSTEAPSRNGPASLASLSSVPVRSPSFTTVLTAPQMLASLQFSIVSRPLMRFGVNGN